jgi:NodT family efflux transporter outer membrane factor (OMF) lipoprotein
MSKTAKPTRHALPLAVSLGLLGLSACAAGPDFQRPSAPADGAYAAPDSRPTVATPVAGGESQSINTGARVAADWYRLFASPKLDALIEAALKGNPTLDAAQARLRQARDLLDASRGGHGPQLDATLGAARMRANGAPLGLGSQPGRSFDLYSAGLSLSYDLDLAGAGRRDVEAHAARAEAQRYVLIGTYITLVDNLVVAALEAATLRDRIAATEDITASEQHQLELVQAQQRAGAVSQADVLHASAQLAAVRAGLPGLRQALHARETELAILSGVEPGAFRAPQLSLADFSLPAELPYSLPSDLVRQRPDILAAESSLHAASAEVGIATADLYPHLTLSAGYGASADEGGTLLDPASRTWSIGGGLLAPLFHGGALRAQRDAAVENYNAAYAQYRVTVLAAFGQVTDTLDAVRSDAEALQAQYAARAAAAASRDLAEAQYRHGAAAYLDVLSAEQAFQRADIAYVDALGQRFVDSAGLYHALGGGWWSAGSPVPGAE